MGKEDVRFFLISVYSVLKGLICDILVNLFCVLEEFFERRLLYDIICGYVFNSK